MIFSMFSIFTMDPSATVKSYSNDHLAYIISLSRDNRQSVDHMSNHILIVIIIMNVIKSSRSNMREELVKIRTYSLRVT